MRANILVKPNSKIDSVEKAGDELVVRVKARAVDSKANEAVVRLLAEYFDVPKTRVKIIRGLTSRRKTIEIEN